MEQMQSSLLDRKRRGAERGVTPPLLLLLLLLAVGLACSVSTVTAAADRGDVALTCSYCQERGYPYLCQATMASGICFINSGEMSCNGEKGCTCCRTADAAGCTFCSVEAEWDTYDDGEEDI
ncbi:hypothetical protein NESM_000555100 [Novymonas esmeraldas]|uniref:Uncharacterized protein n=1 Tax=Novymonas esmeraldas TaxID=1808958 RepID=A0AAW0EPT1_9TRYP